jgi:uncharacterized protein YcfL
MKSLSYLILVSILIIGCNSKKNSKLNRPVISDTSSSALYKKDTGLNHVIYYEPNYSFIKFDTSNITLNFFDKVPETISFKGEFYTYDTTKLADNKYIFLTNMGSYAIIKNNGRDIYLEKKYDKCLALSHNTYKDVYSGNDYEIIFLYTEIDAGYGKSSDIGKLIIENSRHQLVVKVHGGYNLNYR